MAEMMVPLPLRMLFISDSPLIARWGRRLGKLDPQLEVVRPTLKQLPTYLSKPHYYHILQISVGQWTSLPGDLRQAIGQRLSCVVLAPDTGIPFPAPTSPAWVHLRPGAPEQEVPHLLRDFYLCLLQTRRLANCLQAASYWQFHGDEACWPEAPAAPAASVSVALDPPPAPLPVPPAAPAIAIGKVEVHGDIVEGDKIMQTAGGDQVNINRLSGDASLQQTAGGDQININRSSKRTGHASPADASDGVLSCPNCGRTVARTAKFCQYCGHSLAG